MLAEVRSMHLRDRPDLSVVDPDRQLDKAEDRSTGKTAGTSGTWGIGGSGSAGDTGEVTRSAASWFGVGTGTCRNRRRSAMRRLQLGCVLESEGVKHGGLRSRRESSCPCVPDRCAAVQYRAAVRVEGRLQPIQIALRAWPRDGGAASKPFVRQRGEVRAARRPNAPVESPATRA